MLSQLRTISRPLRTTPWLTLAGVWPLTGCLTNLAAESVPHTARTANESATRTTPHGTAPTVDTSSPGYLSPEQWQATLESTRELRSKLKRLGQSKAFAFGNEDSTAYGIGWHGDADRSDIKAVCGAHPAVYGWDLFGIELGHKQNGDGVDFGLICRRMQEAHGRGGINTVSWHAYNPVTRKDAWNVRRTVPEILPGGTHHQNFVADLERVAAFFEQCRGAQGELLPVIFRPFHEHTGGWFWWGANTTTAEEYVALFRFVVRHLRETRGMRQLLFALSPVASDVQTKGAYLRSYPGDEYVDVLGVDAYYQSDASTLTTALEVIVDLAQARGKVAALTEFGIDGGLSAGRIPVEHWFTRSFLTPLRQSAKASYIAYAMTWRNARPDHCFVPYPMHPAAADFKAFCDDPLVLLDGELGPR